MGWDLLIWGLLLGIGGMIWMIVLALPGKATDGARDAGASPVSEGSARTVKGPSRAA